MRNESPSYQTGFAPRDGQPLYPELWKSCELAAAPCLGPSGLTLRDWSGFGKHGTLTNGPSWVVSGGRYALDLDGTNDYIVASRTAQIVAVSMWVRPASTSGARRLMSINTNAFSMYCPSGDNSVYVPYNNADANSLVMVSTTAWTHVCASFDGVNLTSYQNGVQKSSRSVSAASLGTEPIYLGSLNTSFGIQYWHGGMDDVMMFSRPVSARQAALLASRRGVAYELAPRRRSLVQVAGGGFKAAWIPRRSLIVGGGTN